ncbi:hypothetical protein FHS95_000213 [Sphingomonas naasensis]|uniref:Uncharacterized protein n=1 Tax=Sphingomonas naasensis TaxID=1344951 RepID=A0A4S1WSY2_9SPHN|nr:hypothetical protein [Sphingomonas naasensis]NIJ18544.1 hypothetical protein [Sphingomonas naasensis]TGX45795.1 hypothetical protein E5A74_01030 [Sphingomonas naasensis]
MRNVLTMGLVLGCAAIPALAGERPQPILKTAANTLAAHAPLWAARDKRTPVASGLQPFTLPAASAQPKPVPRLTLLAEPVPKRAAELSTPTRWGPGATLPQVTARAGASYAVDDVMNARPKPRRRGSPLSAALVLRLDGQDDSPAFSVGGGGVAAAVWRAVPR